jgi:hypothetical protein
MVLTQFRVVALAVAAGIVALPTLAVAAPATLQFAQSDQPAQSEQPAPSAQSAPEAVVPNDEQIESFVTATVRIIRIQREAQQEITAAKESEAQKDVRDNAMLMIVAALEEEGLSVDEYNGIVEHVEGNPELGETVKQRIQEQVAQ